MIPRLSGVRPLTCVVFRVPALITYLAKQLHLFSSNPLPRSFIIEATLPRTIMSDDLQSLMAGLRLNNYLASKASHLLAVN